MIDKPIGDLGAQVSEKSNATSLDFSEVVLAFKKNWIWILILVTVGFAAAYSYMRWTQPKYSASSILKLEISEESGVIGMNFGSKDGGDNYNDLSGEVEFIKSNLIFDEVIKKDKLELSYHQEGQFKDEEKFGNEPFEIVYDKSTINSVLDTKIYIIFINSQEFKYGIGDSDNKSNFSKAFVNQELDLNGFKFSVKLKNKLSESMAGVPFYIILHSYQSLKNYMSSNLDVSILNVNAKTIKISFIDINAAKAAKIVNSIDTVYLNKTIEKKQMAQQQTLDFISSQLDSAENKLNIAETSIENFVRNVKTSDPNSEFASTLVKLDELREVVKEIDQQIFFLIDLNRQVDLDLPMENPLSVYSGIENDQIKSNILLLNEQVTQLQKLKLTYSESTVAFKKQKREADNLKNGLKELINKDAENLNKHKSRIVQDMSALQERFYSLPSKETELNRLKRFYNLYEKYYLTLQEKGVEFGIAKAGTVPKFVILAKAYPDNAPVSPVKIQVYAICVFIGVFLGVLLLVFRLLMQNTILSENDLKNKLNVAFLGSVPRYVREKMVYSRVIVSENPKSSISESFRSIRTNIEFMCSLDKKRVLGITSTTSGEGKTFVSVNIAAIIAAADKKVVLLDFDMRKPKVHYCFDVENTLGISNILAGKSELRECLRKSDVENLSFITAGSIPPNPTELMLRPSFNALLEELQKQFDIILIDTPPVGIVTDANIILKKTDVAMFVLRSEYTRKGSESIVNSMSATNQFKDIGVILNSVDPNMSYGYGYGYGYGYYDEDQNKNIFNLDRLIKRKNGSLK